MLFERFPRSLQQQRVTGGQNRASPPQILSTTLHREHQQIATRCDHARERLLPDEVGSWRDHDFG